MGKAIKNQRCPLQAECERKCEYEGHELDCSYYSANGYGDAGIPDQEEIRKEQETKREEERYLAELGEDDADETDESKTSDDDTIRKLREMIERPSDSEKKGVITWISVDNLFPHPDNPRKDLGDLTELSDSIKVKGVLQNLTVVPFVSKFNPGFKSSGDYTVIIGHRRLAAAKLAGLTELPCVIAEMTPQEQVATMLLENMQRSDLTYYEQAQGFQMMLDFGDSVENVASKTGFSQTTVRRRLKLAELDQKKLKAASTRQISLVDIDKLSQIEDVTERNKILDDIGTPNYERSIKNALEAQKRKKYESEWREALTAKGLKEIDYGDTFSGKYKSCEKSYCSMGTVAATEYVFSGDEMYFSFNYNTVYFRKESTDEDNRKAAEQDRKNAILRERREKVKDAFARAYELRHDFVFSISETEAKNNAHLIIEFLIRKEWERAGNGGYYMRYIHEVFLDHPVRGSEGYELISDQVHNKPFLSLLRHAYTLWADNDDLGYADYGTGYAGNERLDIIYDFLVAMGYTMSDEEISLKDGTNQLYSGTSENDTADSYDDDCEEDEEDEEEPEDEE